MQTMFIGKPAPSTVAVLNLRRKQMKARTCRHCKHRKHIATVMQQINPELAMHTAILETIAIWVVGIEAKEKADNVTETNGS